MTIIISAGTCVSRVLSPFACVYVFMQSHHYILHPTHTLKLATVLECWSLGKALICYTVHEKEVRESPVIGQEGKLPSSCLRDCKELSCDPGLSWDFVLSVTSWVTLEKLLHFCSGNSSASLEEAS